MAKQSTNMKPLLIALIAGIAPAVAARAQILTFAFSGGEIPDNAATGGLLLAGVVPTGGTPITNLRVTLSISGAGSGGAFNGDFYAWLKHDTGVGTPGFAILLNRPGARSGDSFGYSDNGLSVTFDDSAGAADIHSYRQTLYGSHDTVIPSPGILTGVWATDGRESDPGVVLDTDSRTATLGSFVGQDAGGLWLLYVQDLEGGGVGKVDHWDLEITGPVAVPEPAEATAVAGGALGLLALWRGRRRPVR